MKWKGPFRIRDLLEHCIDDSQEWPPESGGVYVVTRLSWKKCPSLNSGVLYVGGNTGKSKRFVTRVGDLIIDMLGFYGKETGHHSGGQTLYWEFCYKNQINPLELFLGWQTNVSCPLCTEYKVYQELSPEFNKKRPARCWKHGK